MRERSHDGGDRVVRTGERGRGGVLGGGGDPLPPTNVVPPTLTGAVHLGDSPTVAAGTWTGSPSLTYTYKRDGVAVGGLEGVSLATILAHVYVAADVGPTITVDEVPNGNTGSAVPTNALAWDDVQAANDAGGRAVWDARHVTFSGSDVATVTDRSGHGNGLAVGTGTAPAYVASDAGFNDEPCITADGGTEWLRVAAFDFGVASVDGFGVYAVLRVDTPTTNDLWCAYGTAVLLRQAAGPVPQMAVAGTGGATSTATTAMTGAHLVGGDAELVSGDVRALMDGAVEDSDANTRAALADDSAFAVFARVDGTNAAAASLAYAVVLDAPASAGYLAELHAYCQHRFGVP